MSEVRIVAEPRTEFGKGHARRVRMANKVPAVLYGHGDAPRHFSLPGHELMMALRHDANALLTLETAEGDQLALAKAVVRDPLKGNLEHVDLVAVRKGEKVTVEADATALPDHVEVSIAGLQPGQKVTAGDVTLPSGVSLQQDAEHVIVQGLGVQSEAELDAELDAAAAELAPDEPEAEGDSPDTEGSESDKAGDGDVVAESDGPKTDSE